MPHRIITVKINNVFFIAVLETLIYLVIFAKSKMRLITKMLETKQQKKLLARYQLAVHVAMGESLF